MPVTIIREELISYDTQTQKAYDRQEMERQLEEILLDKVNGQVLSQNFSEGESNGVYVLTLRSHCLEDIALAVDMPG